MLTDPHGATFGVHGTTTEPRPETPTVYGEFSWHELATNAGADEAFAFYSALFGWDKLDSYDMGEPMGAYLLFGRNGKQLGGMFKKGEMGKPGPAYWVGYVRVPDVDKTVDSVKAARGTLLNGPMDVPGGDRIAQLADPHGAFFAVHMLAADVRKPPAKVEAAAAKPAKPAKPAAAAPLRSLLRPRSCGAREAAAPRDAKPKKVAKKKAAKKAAKKARRQRRARRKGQKKAAKRKPKKAAKKEREEIGEDKNARRRRSEALKR